MNYHPQDLMAIQQHQRILKNKKYILQPLRLLNK